MRYTIKRLPIAKCQKLKSVFDTWHLVLSGKIDAHAVPPRACGQILSTNYQILSTDLPPQLRQYARGRFLDRAFRRESAGALVSAAAEFLRDFRHVHRALAADADPDALMRHFTKEDRNLNASDAKRVIDQPFTVFIERAKTLHVLPRNGHPCNRAIALQR